MRIYFVRPAVFFVVHLGQLFYHVYSKFVYLLVFYFQYNLFSVLIAVVLVLVSMAIRLHIYSHARPSAGTCQFTTQQHSGEGLY